MVILDKSNTIIAVLGHNSNPKTRVNFNVPQDQWIEGVFSGTHGSYWDKEGNLYVYGRQVPMFAGESPGQIPWGDLGVDVVIESSLSPHDFLVMAPVIEGAGGLADPCLEDGVFLA